MRIKLLIGICLVLLSSGSMAWGQTGAITLDAVDTTGTGVLDTGTAITFSIRLNNNTGSTISGFTNGYKIYSPDGATWFVTDTGQFTGAITSGMTGQQFVNPFSVDGVGADTIGFGGFTIFGTGIPDGFNDIAYTITIDSIPATSIGKQICIDSAFYPPAGTWQWSTDAGSKFPAWDGPHCFDIVTGGGGGTPNQDPVLDPIGAKNINENALLSFTVTASDAESIPIISGAPLPGTATFNDNLDGTATFNWTPGFTDSGAYNITFTATDDSGAVASEIVTITVNNNNRNPVLDSIGPKATTETVQLTFAVTASDPDGDIPVLTSSALPTGATFTSGTFDWTPTIGQAGAHNITFYATDNLGAVDSEAIVITVGPFVPANALPVLDSIGDKSTDENATLSFQITASDADSDLTVLTMSAPTLPPGALFINNGNDTGSFAWTPSYADAGNYSVTFYAIDTAASPDDSVSETISLIVNNVNRPPVWGTLTDQNVDEGANLNFGVSASDLDGAALTLWASGLPGTATFTDNGDGTGIFDWNTNFDDSGSYAVTFSAADAEDTVSGFLTVTVNNINRDPIMSAIGNKSVAEGGTLSFGASAIDADSDALTMTMTSPDLPPAAGYTDNGDGTGSFLWTTTPADAGTYSATFRADDPNGGFAEETITISVSDVNSPPVISGVADFQITECDTIMAIFTATDQDGDSLQLWVDPLITNMTFTDNGGGSGDFFFAPSLVQAGEYTAMFYATDGNDTVTASFTVFVTNCQPGSEGDTLFIATVPAVPGSRVVAPISFTNVCSLSEVLATIGWESNSIRIDSVSFVGSRVEGLASKVVTIDNTARTLTIDVAVTGQEGNIPVSSGLLGNIYFSLDAGIADGTYAVNPFLVESINLNPTFVRDCGSGLETVPTFVVPGGIIVRVVNNFVCGKVTDTAHNAIPGATVELWADYPTSGINMSTTANSFGSFAFDSFTVMPYDLYAYADGYYPGKVENLNFGQRGIMIVLTPLADIYPTNEWVNFYCSLSTMSGAPLPVGSVIDAFDPDGIRCGTWTVTESGKYGFMPVYSDNQFQPGDQGADPGDLIRLFVNGVEALVSGNNIWTANGDSHEVCLEVSEQVPHVCPLVEGWNLVSWPVDTDNDEIASVLASISDCIDIVLGFEQGGLTYDPMLPDFSTLGQVDHLSGYWIKIKTGCQATLNVSGRAVPTTTPIPVTTGWNLVSYLPDTTMPVADALASIQADLVVAQGFDGVAQTYVPGDIIHNNLTDLSSCFGYWVQVTQPGTLIYPGPGGLVAPSRNSVIPLAVGVNADIAKSTSWMNLYSQQLTLNGTAVAVGSMVTAHNSDGMVIGRYTIGENGLFGFMAVYADDPKTIETEGVRRGESFYLSVDGVRTDESFAWTQTGDRVEIHNLTAKFEDGVNLPTKYSLKQNYPNPFNPSTTISFSMKNAGEATLEVYNILGELVARPFDGLAQAGANEVIWDGMDNNGSAVSSGVYFYRLTAGDYSETRKMMLLK